MRNVCKNASSWRTGLFCWFCWSESACTTFLATTTHLFSQGLSSHTLRSCLQIFSTTNNICNFWHSKFRQISPHEFRSWDHFLTEEWNWSSTKNLCKCVESPPTLLTSISIEWNLDLSWSNRLLFGWKWLLEAFLHIKTKLAIRTEIKGFFDRLSTQCEYYEKNFWAVVWIVGS